MAPQTILIVDDEQVERDILALYLQNGGYQCITACNGAEALTLLGQNQVDCILLDVQMPVMDGFQTIDAIKQKKALAQIPVIFLTSMERNILKIRGLEMGASHYVTKPFNKAVLFATIKSVLRKQADQPLPDMEGDLEQFQLVELLQSLEFGQKVARVDIGEGEGEIYIEHSLVHYVRFMQYEGEDAFLRLLLFARGRYTVTFGTTYAGKSGRPLPLVPLLMDSTRQYDELQSQISRLPSGGTLVEVAKGEPLPKGVEKLAAQGPVTLRTALNSMELPVEESVALLIELQQQNRLIDVTQEIRA